MTRAAYRPSAKELAAFSPQATLAPQAARGRSPDGTRGYLQLCSVPLALLRPAHPLLAAAVPALPDFCVAHPAVCAPMAAYRTMLNGAPRPSLNAVFNGAPCQGRQQEGACTSLRSGACDRPWPFADRRTCVQE